MWGLRGLNPRSTIEEVSFFSRSTKGGKPPTDDATAQTEAAPAQPASPPSAHADEGPKRTRTEPMMTAIDRRPVPAPPPKVVPTGNLDSTKRSGPDVLVSRVVDISTSPPPPRRRPELPVDAFAPARPPQATVDWANEPITTQTEPDLGAAAAAARAQADPPPSRPAQRPIAPSFDVTAPKGPFASDNVESLLDEVDAGFESILGDEGARTRRDDPLTDDSSGKTSSGGLSDARALFTQLAAGHVRHVRDFMIDVLGSQAKTDWVSVCQPAIESLREMTKQLDMVEVSAALDAFAEALSHAGADRSVMVEGEARRRLIDAYQPLVMAMPAAFTLDDARSTREGIIVQSLLLQIPEVRKVALDKLYAAGLTSLGVYYVAKPEEITVTTGISTDVARKIVERFKRYKQEIEGATVDAERSFEHRRLAELAAALDEHHRAFVDAEISGDPRAKRQARKAREDVLLEVKVLLARLGETDRIAAMEKLPFAQKVNELKGYLDEARAREGKVR